MEYVIISVMAGIFLTAHLSRLSPQPRFTMVTGTGLTIALACLLAGSYLFALLLFGVTGWIFYLSAASLRSWQLHTANQAIDYKNKRK